MKSLCFIRDNIFFVHEKIGLVILCMFFAAKKSHEKTITSIVFLNTFPASQCFSNTTHSFLLKNCIVNVCNIRSQLYSKIFYIIMSFNSWAL